jgi:hypothetical protein
LVVRVSQFPWLSRLKLWLRLGVVTVSRTPPPPADALSVPREKLVIWFKPS